MRILGLDLGSRTCGVAVSDVMGMIARPVATIRFDEDDYENMTSKALYKLCCDRGISSQCKKRDKASLIAVLKANDGAADEDEADDWGDEDEEEKDPYAGKSAKELFKMCSDRGIRTKPKQSADAYVKLLKKADEAEAETEDEDDEDDDWEI